MSSAQPPSDEAFRAGGFSPTGEVDVDSSTLISRDDKDQFSDTRKGYGNFSVEDPGDEHFDREWLTISVQNEKKRLEHETRRVPSLISNAC